MNEHFLKISAARNVKILTRKEKQNREVSWNPRFFVEKMPEYDASKDKYLQSLLSTLKNKKFAPKSRKIKIRSPKTVQKSSSSKRLAYVQVNRLETLSKIQVQVESVYISKGIPIEFFKALCNSVEGLDVKVSIVLLSKHLQDLTNDKSLVQIALKAVKVRERFLQQIQDTLALGQVDRKTAADLLSIISVYSIQAVEAIAEWRETMDQVNPALPRNTFCYHDQNYLEKMAKDLQFLKDSVIVKSLGSSLVFNFIPNFSEKKVKNYNKRLLDAETFISEELSPSFKQSVFELRNKKSEKKIDGSFNELKNKKGENLGTEDIDNSETKGNSSLLEIIETTGELLPQIQEFSKSVPDQIKKCLGEAEKAYSTSQTLKFPSYLWITQNNSKIGFLILNLETQKTQQKRLFLSHISAKSLETLEKVIQTSINYCKSTYFCDEIRVSLSSPQNAEGKYESDKSIKRFFDSLGFRWKVLIKDRTDFPVHILGLTVDKSESQKSSDLFQDSLKFSYACLAQQSVENLPKTPGLSDIGQTLVLRNLLSGNSPDDTSEKLKLEGFSSSIPQILGKVTQKWSPPAFKLSEHESLESVKQETEKLGLGLKNVEDSKTVLSVCSVELNWVKFLTTAWKNLKYLLINCEINVMTSKSRPVYIIPTEDPSFSVFLIPSSEKPVLDVLGESKEILSNLSETQDKLTELWLPEFRVKSFSFASWQNFRIQESSELHVKAALHPKGNARLSPGIRSLVISESFLFGLINSKIDEEFEVPYSASYVRRSDFIALS